MIGIGDIVPVMSAAGKKIRRTVVVEDAELVFKHICFVYFLWLYHVYHSLTI